ncbi:amidohydrolase/deacetylase family metallohydrolase [Dyadobacter sediminis]|uniref:Amidohydrolase/deacetylase family metallohydrolase n=1 Tax=Dyadobacter sediminis TaxID=1493691 RepID=A0A5R9KIF7_9BACT|nr:amidohydrolase/deacetylase family metallohydrolase [Dyadobacter sediminis]TLU95964.1 amidohydrolase/deacetylase family metallohydrolase [Dyadobacter sediminis]GGB78122.1 dihydroorotase [Dyadobacter sediminis]
MNKKSLLAGLAFFFSLHAASAQKYSIVIKGGTVIDPKNNINTVMDVALKGDTVMLVAKNIDPKEGMQVVNAKGLYVTPGLIDMHSHNFYGTNMDQTYSNGPNALQPDGFTFRTGVTTVVDAGCSGWKSFPAFKKQTIDASRTRVLAFLNIVGEGMRGGTYEQNIEDMNAAETARVAKENPEDVVGIKLAHYNGYNWTPTDRAVEAGKLANVPVMIDFGGSKPVLSIEELFMKHLRPGDIFTHCFGQLSSREPILDVATGKVKPFVYEARKKGILFDVGYGGISFAFSQAIPAVKSGFYPNTISTDIHTGSMNNAMKDMLNVMSKFLAMGMDLPAVIKASTWAPAQAIHREQLGNLSVGSRADVTVLRMLDGKFQLNDTGTFGFFDYTGTKIHGKHKLEAELTIRAGKVVYDLNGITNPLVLSSN